MKLREKFRRFWTMNVHNHEGFTLVELIIVIAILAILSSVAVVGYSSYVEKANKQADITLVTEIVNSLDLAYYAGTLKEGGYIILSAEGIENIDDLPASMQTALDDAFGSSWRSFKLQYTGWNSSYTESSFQGKETVLLTHVEDLTGVLGDFLAEHPEVLGDPNNADGFKNYMGSQLGFSPEDMDNSEKAADAAVLYVANGTSNLTPEKKQEFTTVVTSSDGDFFSMLNGLIDVYGSTIKGAAATYAMVTAYCQYEDRLAGNTKMMDALGTPDASNVTTGSASEMTEVIMTSVMRLDQLMADDPTVGTHWDEYWKTDVKKDIDAFLSVMTTANSAASQIKDNLGTQNCFSSAELQELFGAYGEGNVIILVETLTDGSLKARSLAAMD